MSSLGTRRKGKSESFEVSLPVNLKDRFESLLFDRYKGKPVFGARSQIITSLVERWVTEREQEVGKAVIIERQEATT